MCDCGVCKRSRHFDEVCRNGDVEEMRKAIQDLLNALIETEEEYYMLRADSEEKTG